MGKEAAAAPCVSAAALSHSGQLRKLQLSRRGEREETFKTAGNLKLASVFSPDDVSLHPVCTTLFTSVTVCTRKTE